MGVRGLQTFITNQVIGGVNVIDIKKEIKSWKSANEEALIVIDLFGFTSIANNDKIVQYCGGRFKQLQDRFEAFFQALVDAGAKLAFFVDGPHQKEKDEIWHKRQDAKYANEMKLIDAVDSGQQLSDILNQMKTLNTGPVALARPLEAICKSYGLFKTAISNEGDLELAQYACQNKAMAILAQDSDFLIFDGNWQYWSSERLDLENMTTFGYSRPALCASLGLAQSQMCMLATLCGNDLISVASLAKFHQMCLPYNQKFKKIANHMRLFPASPKHFSQQDLQRIASHCFGAAAGSDKLKLLRSSIESYSLDRVLSGVDTEKIDFGENTIFMLKMGIPYPLTLSYVDLRRDEFSNMWEIFIPIIQRQAGMVLQNEAINKQECSAFVKRSHQRSYEQVTLRPEFPAVELEKLHRRNDTTMDGVHFELLSWIVTGDSKGILGIACIPMGYTVVTTVLFFLVKEQMAYDGIYFHLLSQKWGSDSCQFNKALLEPIAKLRKIYVNLV